MERCDFSSISTCLKNQISESNQMNQPDFLYELFEDFMNDPINEDFSMDNGLICRWITGQAKISPKITSYYAKPSNQKKLATTIQRNLLPLMADCNMVIRNSFDIAREQGIDFSFTPNEAETDVHPNTVDIHMVNEQGQEMTVRGESLGGGKVRIVEINHVKVDFTGEYSAIIVIHQDTPGVVAYITRCLSERNINIAFMRLFRESKGTTAYTIVESDGHLPEDIVESIHRNTNIHDVMVVQM